MTDPIRFSTLLDFCLGLADPKTNAARYEKAKPLIASATAVEVMYLVDAIIEAVPDIEDAKPIVTRLLNVFGNVLTSNGYVPSKDIPYIATLVEENAAIVKTLDAMKSEVTAINKDIADKTSWDNIRKGFDTLYACTQHYTDKENILFPFVERFIPKSGCLKLMWSIHDDIRLGLKRMDTLLHQNEITLESFNSLVGQLFFDIRSMVFREERVLLAAMEDVLNPDQLEELKRSQFAHGQVSYSGFAQTEETIHLVTGSPTATQLIQIFNHLPVDITLVDKYDRVVYFNTPEHRIFPRTAAVVGRTVQNCHPPKSVHIVNNILEAFREKRETKAEFYITMKGSYIVITYFALYDQTGEYDGTLEVSQDITHLKTLEGEKRLLDWH